METIPLYFITVQEDIDRLGRKPKKLKTVRYLHDVQFDKH
jgi:hypothetical protein